MKYAGQTHQTTNTILLLSISFSIPPHLDDCYTETRDHTCAPVFCSIFAFPHVCCHWHCQWYFIRRLWIWQEANLSLNLVHSPIIPHCLKIKQELWGQTTDLYSTVIPLLTKNLVLWLFTNHVSMRNINHSFDTNTAIHCFAYFSAGGVAPTLFCAVNCSALHLWVISQMQVPGQHWALRWHSNLPYVFIFL